MRLAIALSIAAAACGTSPVDPAAPDAGTVTTDSGSGASLSECDEAAQHSDLAYVQQHVFSMTCAKSNCHVTGNEAGGLILEDGKAHDYLVNMPTRTLGGWMRVVAGDPAHSYLLVAVGGTAGPMPDGGFMPWGGQPMLCAGKITAIKNWIAGGASAQ